MATTKVTNAAFLTEKRHNFVKFVREAIQKRTTASKLAKFQNKLVELEHLEISLFITAIVETMVSYKANPDHYVLKMLNENGLSDADISNDELAKAARYISCFIDIVS